MKTTETRIVAWPSNRSKSYDWPDGRTMFYPKDSTPEEFAAMLRREGWTEVEIIEIPTSEMENRGGS